MKPPTIAPTIPRTMSRKKPWPVLLTTLLAIKPAIRPRIIHPMIDITPPFAWRRVRLMEIVYHRLEPGYTKHPRARAHLSSGLPAPRQARPRQSCRSFGPGNRGLEASTAPGQVIAELHGQTCPRQ